MQRQQLFMGFKWVSINININIIEHPPSQGGGMPERLGGNIKCKDNNSSWDLNGLVSILISI